MARPVHAFVETTRGPGQYDELVFHVIPGLDAANVPWTEATKKLIQRGRVPLRKDTLAIGCIPFVHTALAKLDIPLPEVEDYPEELTHLLHRKVWSSTLRETPHGFFVKPKQVKKFTGHIWTGTMDPRHGSANRRSPVWVSEPVEWISEWRCFVARGEPVGKRNYSGDPEVHIDNGVLREAITARPDAPWGYALDLGILSTGETALVEHNHGYSLGHYDLDPEAYLEVLSAFWEWVTRDVSRM